MTALSSFDLYRRQFRDPEFGRQAALAIARKHDLKGVLRRNINASNLVFEFNNGWLKLCPPFWREAYLAELRVLAAWDAQLPLTIPHVVAADSFDGWSYLITTHVTGEQYRSLGATLTFDDQMALAQQVGELIGVISRLQPLGLACNGNCWPDFARHQIDHAAVIHRERAHSETWPIRIANFLQENAHLVLSLGNIRTIHADINQDHLLLDKDHLLLDSASKRITGLIDFADAMDAPIELEFALPFLCFFKGNYALQQRAIQSSGISFGFAPNEFSFGMMALTLMNRFISFEEWFDVEINSLEAACIEDVARIVYPSEDSKEYSTGT